MHALLTGLGVLANTEIRLCGDCGTKATWAVKLSRSRQEVCFKEGHWFRSVFQFCFLTFSFLDCELTILPTRDLIGLLTHILPTVDMIYFLLAWTILTVGASDFMALFIS